MPVKVNDVVGTLVQANALATAGPAAAKAATALAVSAIQLLPLTERLAAIAGLKRIEPELAPAIITICDRIEAERGARIVELRSKRAGLQSIADDTGAFAGMMGPDHDGAMDRLMAQRDADRLSEELRALGVET